MDNQPLRLGYRGRLMLCGHCMETPNPYLPPKVLEPDARTRPARQMLVHFLPAALSVGLTSILWVAIVSVLDRSFSQRFDIALWSVSLFLSASIAVGAVSRIARRRPYPFAFMVAYSISSIVFCLLEGDTSNGTNWFQMSVVYGTLVAVPFVAYLVARGSLLYRTDPERIRDGG